MISDRKVEIIAGGFTWTAHARPHTANIGDWFWFGLSPGGIAGWEDMPDGRHASDARPSGGDFDDRVMLDSAVTTFTGFCRARDAVELEQFRAQLVRLRRDGGDVVVRVTQAGLLLESRGRVDVVNFQTGRDPCRAEWRVRVWRPDPLKYGEARKVVGSSRVSISNRGNWPAWPVVSVGATQRMPLGYGVWQGSRCLRISAPLEVGEWHDIDMRTGIVRKGGALVSPAVHSGPLLTVPPDQGLVEFSVAPVQGAAVIAVSSRDTYL